MNIYTVPEGKRYWVVRAEDGQFYDHFTKYGVAAIGHLMEMTIADTKDGEVYEPGEKELIAAYKRLHTSDEHKKRTVSVQLSQIKSFIYEMSVGDWVITVGHKFLRFGRITSSAYISNDLLTIVYEPGRGRKVDMRHNLRRNVVWGPMLARKELPYGLVQSLKSNLTVFNIDKHWEAVHHTLYPAFMRDDHLYLSSKIKADHDIKNYSVSAIFTLLNEIEVIAKEFPRGKLTKDNFEQVYDNYIEQEKLTVTTKAQFHSPGDIWNAISSLGGIEGWATYMFVGYSMLFGNKLLGLDGLLDLDTRHKLRDLILERVKTNKAGKVVDSLQLEQPKYDTVKLEDDSNDAR